LQIQAKNLCEQQETIMFGYFNGMKTTKNEALKAKRVFEEKYGYETPFPHNNKIEYEVFYNQTKGYLPDIAEIFEQRFMEKHPKIFAGRYEFFFEATNGGGKYLTRLATYEALKNSDEVDFVDQDYLAKLAQETAQEAAYIAATGDEKIIDADQNTYKEYIIHRKQIDSHLQQNNKMIFAAYSQGNLFAGAAYLYAAPLLAHPQQLKVVHIAPASQRLYGNHVLSDKDLIIKYLLGSLNYTVPVTDINVKNPADKSGHSLLDTYLDPKQATAQSIDNHLNNTFSQLQTAGNSNNQAFFTLEFDYKGKNMNFTLTEPNGGKLYQDNQQGKNGYLSVRKNNNGGTIQYLASCEDNQLQAGSYKIQIKEPTQLQREHALLKTNSHLNEIDLVHLSDHSAIKQNGVNIWNYAIKVNLDALSNKYSYSANFTQNSKNKVRGLTK